MYAGKKVFLRAVEESDVDDLHRWLNDESLCQNLSRYWPSSTDEIREECSNLAANSLLGQLWMIEVQGEAIGFVKLYPIDWVCRSAEFTIAIAPEAQRGQGYGADATRTALRVAFDVLNLHQVTLHVYDNNASAIQCYEACGFQRDGIARDCRFVDGAYTSAIRMSILEREYREYVK